MKNSLYHYSRSASALAAVIVALVLLILPNLRISPIHGILAGIGRMHPVVLHFPIVLIVLACMLELVRLYFSVQVPTIYLGILITGAAILGLVSVASGYLLNASGDYSGSLIADHLWAGCITTAMMWLCLAGFLKLNSDQRYYPMYYISLLAATIGTIYTGHLGGSVTHGKDYLVEPLQLLNLAKTKSLQMEHPDPLIYKDMIVPIVEAKCISCHNSLRAKGSFSMASFSALFKPGESGLPSITPGLSDKSELYKRVILPLDHKDHMPPAGKVPLTEDEMMLLKHWIDSGATEEWKIKDAHVDSSLGAVITRLEPITQKYAQKVQLSKIKLAENLRDLNRLGEKIGITCAPDEQAGGDFFSIHTSFPPSLFDNKQLALLRPYFDLISSVSLISSNIDDDALYYIGQMTNVRELLLQKTKIEGSGLIYLQHLPNLESLNLSFTKIDDKMAIDFLQYPKLKEVYLYRTNCSKEVAAAISKYKPGLKVILEEGPYY